MEVFIHLANDRKDILQSTVRKYVCHYPASEPSEFTIVWERKHVKIQTFRDEEYNQIKIDVSTIGVCGRLFRTSPLFCGIEIRHFNKQSTWQHTYCSESFEKYSAKPKRHLSFKTNSTQTLRNDIPQHSKRRLASVKRTNRNGSKFWQAYRYLLLPSSPPVNTIVFTLYALFCWNSMVSRLGKSTCHFSSVSTHKMHRCDFNERASSKRDAAKIRQIGEIESSCTPKRGIAEPNRLQLRQICNSFNGK